MRLEDEKIKEQLEERTRGIFHGVVDLRRTRKNSYEHGDAG